MISHGRLLSIMDILRTKKTVTVSELCKKLNASESTVRRDLAILEDSGKLVRVHGGATIVDEPLLSTESDFLTKSVLFVQEKTKIGEFAAKLICDDDIVFIDAGTTTDKLVDAISPNCKATFVTDGIVHALKLAQKGLNVSVACGMVKSNTHAAVGPQTISFLEKYNFTKSFLGTNGISINSGFTTPESEEACIKRLVAEHSKTTYILADSSKFSSISTITFCSISGACIITDKITDTKYLRATQIKEAQ